jgi:hypothetical protein
MSPKIKPNKTVKKKYAPNRIKSQLHRRSWYRMPERIQNYLIEQIAAGRTCVSLAKELKMSNIGIHCFLKRKGLRVSELRNPNAANIVVAPGVVEGRKVHIRAEGANTKKTYDDSGFSVQLTTGGKSIARNLAFYLDTTPEEIVEAALAKYYELQKEVAKDKILNS